MDDLLLRYGTRELPEKGETIRFGDWSFELVAGDIKNICFAGTEIVRAIGYVVRDANWGTWPQQHLHPTLTRTAQSLTWRGTSHCHTENGCKLTIVRELVLTRDNQLRYSASACPDRAMETARSGITVLYPLQGVAGSPVAVTGTDGSVTHAHFPLLIDPWQPFQHIAQLRYQHAAGWLVNTGYAGEVFEMEDQRAWSDGSYKVYSRPLALPWPYRLAAEETLTQSVSLAVTAISPASKALPALHPLDAHNTLPATGLLLTEAQCEEPPHVVDALAALRPQHLLAHYNPEQNSPHWLATLAWIKRQSQLPLLLEYVLPVRQGEDFRPALALLQQQLAEAHLQPDALIPSPAPDMTSTPPGSEWPWTPALEAIYRTTRELFPDCTLGGGMLSYFTELNRKRPPLGLTDFITHATCPIVHNADDRSVVQTLESLPYITATTRSFIGRQMPYYLGPSMISMRSNPYGSHVYANPQQRRLTMTHEDVRHRGLFFASYLVGYMAGIVDAEVSHWCPAALCGSLGLQPLLSSNPTRWPAWYVVRWFAAHAGQRWRAETPQQGAVAIVIENGEQDPIWLIANLNDRAVTIPLPEGSVQQSWSLDSYGYREKQRPLGGTIFTLEACAVCELTIGSY